MREGATNVIRHSGAQHATIRIEPGLAAASAEIIDDGRGGDGRRRPATGSSACASGCEGLGGELDAGPRPEGGFRLRVSVPVEPA